jgi:CRISPR-associated protein Csa1
MYFISDIDHKKLIGRILPRAREVGVSEELRGWNWHKPPLKPFYEREKIPMYAVCSKYCPTGRDVFLSIVEGKVATFNERVILGVAIHRTVGAVIDAFIEGKHLDFKRWYDEALRSKGVRKRLEFVEKCSKKVWTFTLATCKSRFLDRVSQQPYASKRDTIATALPFLIEHRVSGELLGLSGILSIDCYDYLRGIVFDLKVSEDEKEWYRLSPTGYAIVLESVYEIPVDVGCTVYVKFKGNRLVISRDLFFIGDDLRSWWVEERDFKLEIVAQKKDPGMPGKCYDECIYWSECRGQE